MLLKMSMKESFWINKSIKQILLLVNIGCTEVNQKIVVGLNKLIWRRLNIWKMILTNSLMEIIKNYLNCHIWIHKCHHLWNTQVVIIKFWWKCQNLLGRKLMALKKDNKLFLDWIIFHNKISCNFKRESIQLMNKEKLLIK